MNMVLMVAGLVLVAFLGLVVYVFYKDRDTTGFKQELADRARLQSAMEKVWKAEKELEFTRRLVSLLSDCKTKKERKGWERVFKRAVKDEEWKSNQMQEGF